MRTEALNSVGKLFSLAYPEMYVFNPTRFKFTQNVISRNNVKQAIDQFAWIPDEILQIVATSAEIRCTRNTISSMTYTNQRTFISLRSSVEQVVFDYILPLPSIATSSATKEKEVDEVSWTDRLLITMRHLSEKSIVVLIGLTCLKSAYVWALFFATDTELSIFRRPNVYDVYVESCIQNNVGRHVIFG